MARYFQFIPILADVHKIGIQDPPPWIPAVTQHTTSGASEEAELHMIRAVDTGIINVLVLLVAPNSD